jgi:hypothetical protein
VTDDQNLATGTRYVALAVVPRRRKPLEDALGRVVELGGEALLITADGSAHARHPGVQHIDLLNNEMRWGVNRLIAASPKRVAGRLVGRRVGGRSAAWRHWSSSRPYKVVRYYLLWRVLAPRLSEVRPQRVTNVLLAGSESWPIAWHLTRIKPGIEVGWGVPDAWQPEEETA